jgi:hypothetical protein
LCRGQIPPAPQNQPIHITHRPFCADTWRSSGTPH